MDVFTAETMKPASLQGPTAKESWILDSGASKHMTSRREWFQELHECNSGLVALGDGKMCQVEGRGTIKIKRHNGQEWLEGTLEDVLYVPSLNKNLFSVGACVEKGYGLNFEDHYVKIHKEGKVAALATKQENNLYIMTFQAIKKEEANNATVVNLKLWHERLGHIGLNQLLEISRKDMWDIGPIPTKVDFL